MQFIGNDYIQEDLNRIPKDFGVFILVQGAEVLKKEKSMNTKNVETKTPVQKQKKSPQKTDLPQEPTEHQKALKAFLIAKNQRFQEQLQRHENSDSD